MNLLKLPPGDILKNLCFSCYNTFRLSWAEGLTPLKGTFLSRYTTILWPFWTPRKQLLFGGGHYLEEVESREKYIWNAGFHWRVLWWVQAQWQPQMSSDSNHSLPTDVTGVSDLHLGDADAVWQQVEQEQNTQSWIWVCSLLAVWHCTMNSLCVFSESWR